jgi:hypothetical protein
MVTPVIIPIAAGERNPVFRYQYTEIGHFPFETIDGE